MIDFVLLKVHNREFNESFIGEGIYNNMKYKFIKLQVSYINQMWFSNKKKQKLFEEFGKF